MFYFTHLRRFTLVKTCVIVWQGNTCAQKKVTIFWMPIHINFQFKKLNIHNWLIYMTKKMQQHTLALHSLPLLNVFFLNICANHFDSIRAYGWVAPHPRRLPRLYPNHQLFNHIIFDNLKRSSRVTNTCSVSRPEIALFSIFYEIF